MQNEDNQGVQSVEKSTVAPITSPNTQAAPKPVQTVTPPKHTQHVPVQRGVRMNKPTRGRPRGRG